MIIKSKNFELKLEEITEESSRSLAQNNTEKKVLELAEQWKSGKKEFVFNTSGSTGKPKSIVITRKKINYSTLTTFQYIDPKNQIKNCLLCINPQFIGGAMVVFRALIQNLDLYVCEASSNIAEDLNKDTHFDLASMVPLQYRALSSEDMKRFSNILIGGAPMETERAPTSKTTVYATYGMTETVSHIALRKIDENTFYTLGDISLKTDSYGCLNFKGTITNQEWLTTNDIGNLMSENSFQWIGRKDFIINSGGIKLNPESLESKLRKQIHLPFLISSIPNKTLGEKVVLIIEGTENLHLDFSELNRYEVPKEIIYWKEIPKTSSDKLDRKTLKKQLKDRQ